jgi:hypothetical protein
MGSVVSFLHRLSDSADWSQQELAEFYRVESALLQAGFSVATEQGVSDEGEPWFVFCRADNEEVIAHFARIDGDYVIVSNFHRDTLRGRDFRGLIRKMLESHPMTLTVRRRYGQNVFLHPAALLAALVASAYVISGEKCLASEKNSADGNHRNSSLVSFLLEKFSIFMTAALAGTWFDHHAHTLLQFFDNSLLFNQHSDGKIAELTAAASSELQAVLQAIHNLELGAHRIAANDASGSSPHHSEPQAIEAKATGNLPSTSVTVDTVAASGMPGSDQSGGNQVGDGSHSDNTAGLNTGHFTLVAQTESVAISAGLMGGENWASSSSTTTSEAYHLAEETGDLSVATVVLSTGATSVTQALQQAFQQVGFDPSLLHNSSSASTSDASNEKAAVASPGAVVNSDLASPSSSPPAANQGTTTTANVGLQSNNITMTGISEAQVMQSVETFLNSTPSAEVTVSGANVVIIDTNVADASSAHFGVLTYDMSDGSTLSIVGIIPAHFQATAA